MKTKWIKAAFAASAIYDAIFALVFLIFGPAIYDYFGIERPNHLGYLHFPALLVIVFALLLWRIASDPVKYRDLIPYGIGLKISYCVVVFSHWAVGSMPVMWIPSAWIDLVFLLLFIEAWRRIGKAVRAAV